MRLVAFTVRGWLGYQRSATPNCIDIHSHTQRHKKTRCSNLCVPLFLFFLFAVWRPVCWIKINELLSFGCSLLPHNTCFNAPTVFRLVFGLLPYNLMIACIPTGFFFRVSHDFFFSSFCCSIEATVVHHMLTIRIQFSRYWCIVCTSNRNWNSMHAHFKVKKISIQTLPNQPHSMQNTMGMKSSKLKIYYSKLLRNRIAEDTN